MFSLLSLFKRPKGYENSKAIVKADKLFISSDGKFSNHTIVISETYNVSLFSARNKGGSIHRNNLQILSSCNDRCFLQKHQHEELALLSMSTSKMLIHSALVHKEESYLSFVTKTSKDKPFYCMSDETNTLKVSGVLGYELESGKVGYISGVIYRARLTAASEGAFQDLQNNPARLAHFEYSELNISNMIATYKRIAYIVYVDKLVKPGFHIHYHLYDKVNGNFNAGVITKEKWEEFRPWFDGELKRLKLEPYNPENNLHE